MNRTHSFYLLAFATLLSACNRSNTEPETSVASQPDVVAVQLNWYPESEHGGLYQAASDGTFAAAELNVELRREVEPRRWDRNWNWDVANLRWPTPTTW